MSSVSAASSAFQDYQRTLKPALDSFENFLDGQVSSFEPELKDVISAVLAYKGKRLRPSLVFACAGIHANPNPQALRMAAITELIHLASLIHDDILDSAKTRHGGPAHHLQFTPQISVLTGDTLFLRANEMAAMEDDPWVGRVVSAAAKATCSGEIAQGLSVKSAAPLTAEAYERQLLLKTGKLFGLSCTLGGFLSGLSVAERARLASYGELFGIAYQLYDDAVDVWGSEAQYQKTLGTDQLQHKWTLPWILLNKKIGAGASSSKIESLWNNAVAARAAFDQHDIFASATEIFEGYLSRAEAAINGLPQAALLSAPLHYIRHHWENLGAPVALRAVAK